MAGTPAPASTVPEALASLAFGRDRVETLRQARQQIEAEIPDWEAAAVEAETEVERLISAIIADYVQVLVLEATELSRRLQPYRSALLSFVRDHSAEPTEWHKQDAFRTARQPLDESAAMVWAFKDLREATAPSPCWKAARERLRENPEASVLRNLVAEFEGCAIGGLMNSIEANRRQDENCRPRTRYEPPAASYRRWYDGANLKT